jgi:PHD/YefM family antitoxin component YafN of YafNO toxin-antitoxin module
MAAAAVAAPAAADWWYAVYDGDKHIGYCHLVESTANLGNAVVQRFTAVTEAKRDKAGFFTYKETVDRYRSGGNLVYYSSTVIANTAKGKTVKVKATRTAEGFSITKIKGEKEETVVIPAEEYGMVEIEEALEKLSAPGGKTEVRVLDLDDAKVRKTKLEYVADQSLEIRGETVPTKVIQAKGGLGGATFWFAEDGSQVKRLGSTPLGKVTYLLTEAAEAKP